MERRGSGFKKIKLDYRNAVNCRNEVEPIFKSTATSFFVTLYNLDYNVAIDGEKQAFELTIEHFSTSMPTRKNVLKLFDAFGFETVFARPDVMRITGITESPATTLLQKLKSADLIEPVKGNGKGKYRFKQPQIQ